MAGVLCRWQQRNMHLGMIGQEAVNPVSDLQQPRPSTPDACTSVAQRIVQTCLGMRM